MAYSKLEFGSMDQTVASGPEIILSCNKTPETLYSLKNRHFKLTNATNLI
jgi:hypothetical protein